MTEPIRLTVVLTHPIQYLAAWFRYLAADCPEIDLTVLYATQPTPQQQGIGFGQPFTWDQPLLEGYRCKVIRPARGSDNIHSDRFWGLDVPEIGGALDATRPDVALIGGWYSVTLVRALWACRRRRIPVLVRADTHLGNAPSGWRRPLWRWKNRRLLRSFQGALSVGRRTHDLFRALGVPEERIFAVPHCVDNAFFAQSAAPHQSPEGRAAARAAFGLPDDDFIVLFAGKLEPKKRPQYVIEAVTRLGPGASVLVVGGGPLEPECRELASQHGVRAVWTGFLNQAEMGRAYAVADCLALPSDWGETWGLVVNEALATGLPCVVSDRVGCAPDLIVAGETGEQVPFGDVPRLAEALAHIRARSRSGHDWGKACREKVAGYSFATASHGLLAACRAVTTPASVRKQTPRVLACCGGMVIYGGAERMIFEVLRALREREVPVHCVLNDWENQRIAPVAKAIGATWSTGYYQGRMNRSLRNPRYIARLAWGNLRTCRGLLRDAWRFQPTHVLVSDLHTALRNGAALALLRAAGVKIIYNLQNAPPPGPFYRKVWRWGVNPLVDQFVCVSAHSRRELLAHGIAPAKVCCIPNTIPSREAKPANGKARNWHEVIFVGQVIPQKGLDLLLDAIGLLSRRGRDVSLAVVGQMDGWVAPAYTGYREGLLQKAAEPNLSGRVRFLGWQDDVPALLAGAGMHCLPSRPEMLEGLPLVALEAKQAGIPSIVFPVGPLPELVEHGRDGWICSEVSAAALAEGIDFFLADGGRLERAGQAALRSLEPFQRDRFARAWRAVFGVA